MLWAYRTTKCIPMGETPFSLAYRTEAIIAIDVYMSTLRLEGIDWDQNVAQFKVSTRSSEER